MGALGDLKTRLQAEGDPRKRAEALILGLADLVKATSNDQNVQRLARELRADAPDLVETVAPQTV